MYVNAPEPTPREWRCGEVQRSKGLQVKVQYLLEQAGQEPQPRQYWFHMNSKEIVPFAVSVPCAPLR